MPENKKVFERLNPILHVDNVTIAYDDKVIIKDINIVEYDISRPDAITGQIIAVVGRSGRGKSTLFRALTGLVNPKVGSILIPDLDSDKPNAAKTVREGDMGFVDQKYTLFRHKTVYHILLFALRKSSLTRKEKDDKIKLYLDTWGLSTTRDLYRHELSGGQRQRVAIISQLFCGGHFMVMDEPFSGLDPINIEDVKKSFDIILSQDTLNTIIFSTHDIDLACELAQSVYIIGYPTINGVKASYGTVMQHYDFREMGIAWEPFGQKHVDMVKQIKQDLASS